MLSKFGPIFSSNVGSHANIRDESGNLIISHAKGYPSILEHSHLLLGYYELFSLLEKTYGLDFAVKHTLEVKHGYNGIQTLNKLFYEDYLFLMNRSKFNAVAVYPASTRVVEPETMKTLMCMYPGYSRFDVNSVVIEAAK